MDRREFIFNALTGLFIAATPKVFVDMGRLAHERDPLHEYHEALRAIANATRTVNINLLEGLQEYTLNSETFILRLYSEPHVHLGSGLNRKVLYPAYFEE